MPFLVWYLVTEWTVEIVMSMRRPEGSSTLIIKVFLPPLLMSAPFFRFSIFPFPFPFSVFRSSFFLPLAISILDFLFQSDRSLAIFAFVRHDHAYVLAFRGILFPCMLVLIYQYIMHVCAFSELCVDFTS